MPRSYQPIIEKLQGGERVQFRPTGNSMSGRIPSRALVTLDPVRPDTELKANDAVLCKVKGHIYVHLITAIKGSGDDTQYQISNNHGHVNGWTPRKNVYGIVVGVD